MRVAAFLGLLALAPPLPPLHPSADGRHLVTAAGRPFFWLGDTAWELFHRLTREQTDEYLKDRADKGFNVVLSVALAEYDYNRPNAYGALPLQGNNPDTPNEAYFQHVDWVVRRANERGLYIGFLPTWGDKWNRKWGKGPELFTPENAWRYGEWLGHRYRDAGVVWVLGGDRNIETDRQAAIVAQMAAGLRQGDGGSHLMVFHPQRDAPPTLHQKPWIDIEAFQSGHFRKDSPVYDMVRERRDLAPPKPVLDLEPNYEETAVRNTGYRDRFNALDVRKAAYWCMLSGAAGHTYGHNSIWQFLGAGDFPMATRAITPWRQAMEAPGAAQVGIMRRFFEGLPWADLAPDQSLLISPSPEPSEHPCAAVDGPYDLAVIYTPVGGPLRVRIGRLHGGRVAAAWFDPATGRTTPAESSPAADVHTYAPPASAGGDHVLVLRADGASPSSAP